MTPDVSALNPAPKPSAPVMVPAFCPAWAEVFGEDEFGVFAEFTLKEVRFVWRWIPPGTFLMGSPEGEVGRFDNEGPQHEVTITRGFWMGETPVTQAQWMVLREKNPSNYQSPDRPVEQVTWKDGVAFALKMNAAFPGLYSVLPTEAQWEYACRAGTTGAFHDGSPCTQPEGRDPALDRLGWFDKNSGYEAHPVKQKSPNAWGLYDMHGNVWEWCWDAWYAGAYIFRAEGATDPVFESTDEDLHRVVRGGPWYHIAGNCRAAMRTGRHPRDDSGSRSFRLVAGQEL